MSNKETTPRTVERFDGESWVCVYCKAGSDVVNVQANIADERCANQYAAAIRGDGGHVFRVCKAAELVAALFLIRGRSNGTPPPLVETIETKSVDVNAASVSIRRRGNGPSVEVLVDGAPVDGLREVVLTYECGSIATFKASS